MNAFAAGINAIFRDPNMAKHAFYRAGGEGIGVPVRVIFRAPDRVASFGEGRFVTDTHFIDVRVSDVPNLEMGDTFDIGDLAYEVRSDPVRDREQLCWSAEVRSFDRLGAPPDARWAADFVGGRYWRSGTPTGEGGEVVANVGLVLNGEGPVFPSAPPGLYALNLVLDDQSEIVLEAGDVGDPIVAWGDSLTAGSGASSPLSNYPAVAAQLFQPARVIVNKGIGGQSSSQIAARQGGLPILCTLDGDTIPAAYKWTWDWSTGLDGWYPRVQGGDQDATLSVENGALVIDANPGPQSAGAAQVSLGLADGLPVGYVWTARFNFAGTIGFLNVGLMQDNGVWNGNATPDIARQGIFNGPDREASTTLAYPGANVLALFSGNQSGSAIISELELTAVAGVAVLEKSVNVLQASGQFGGSISGTLADVHGTITSDGDGNWSFNRDDFGPPVHCPPGTPFVPDDAGDFRDSTAWLWVGRNNFSSPDTVKADIAAMIAHLGHGRYLVGGVINSGTEIAGSLNHTKIVSLNAELAATHGPRFVDLRQALISAGDPVLDADDIANDVVPGSLRADNIHLNDHGYGVIAQALFEARDKMGWYSGDPLPRAIGIATIQRAWGIPR